MMNRLAIVYLLLVPDCYNDIFLSKTYSGDYHILL